MTPNNFEYPTAFSVWDDAEYSAIERVVRSGCFTSGEEVRALEEDLAAYHGRAHAISVNNGSDANLLMVAALFHKKEKPLQEGHIAYVPALAWPTTYAPLIQHNLELALVDCDDTWNAAPVLEPTTLRVLCGILGNPARLSDDVDSRYIIEDACESLGARTESGSLTGTFGIMSSVSFYFSHQISAIEGGAILTDDDECARLVRILRDHGLTRSTDKTTAFGEEYNCAFAGYNMRSTEIHAAVGREQLKKLDANIAKRWENYTYFKSITGDLPIVHQRMVGMPSVFGLQFTVKDWETRERLAVALRAAGIDCRPPVGGSFRKHPYGRRWADQKTPMADMIHDTGMFLGNPPLPIPDKIDAAVAVMRAVL